MGKQIFKFDEDSIGSDGEFFLTKSNRAGDGTLAVSSVGIIGGEKDDPIICDGGGYLEDCVAVEINPVPSTRSQGRTVFADNIIKCINAVKRKIEPLDLSIDIVPAKLFAEGQLTTRKSKESGCHPSDDAWEEFKPIEKIDLDSTRWRFASGDLHLGWSLPEKRVDVFYERMNAVRLLDIIMTCNEVLASPKNRRRLGYGKPGICRPTNYGIEYKSASNFWMRTREEMEWAYDVGMWVIGEMYRLRDFKGPFYETAPLYSEYKHSLTHIKDRWDREAATDYLSSIEVARCPSIQRG